VSTLIPECCRRQNWSSWVGGEWIPCNATDFCT